MRKLKNAENDRPCSHLAQHAAVVAHTVAGIAVDLQPCYSTYVSIMMDALSCILF